MDGGKKELNKGVKRNKYEYKLSIQLTPQVFCSGLKWPNTILNLELKFSLKI